MLAKDEDTVAVGQELAKLEPGGAPAPKKEEPAEKPKPEEPKPEEPKPSEAEKPKPSESEKPKPAEAEKPKPAEQKPSPPPKSEEPKQTAAPPVGSRGEERVSLPIPMCYSWPWSFANILIFTSKGKNEPYEVEDCGAFEAIPEHGCLLDYFQRGRYVVHHGFPKIVQG